MKRSVYLLGCHTNFLAFVLEYENGFLMTEGLITNPNSLPLCLTHLYHSIISKLVEGKILRLTIIELIGIFIYLDEYGWHCTSLGYINKRLCMFVTLKQENT